MKKEQARRTMLFAVFAVTELATVFLFQIMPFSTYLKIPYYTISIAENEIDLRVMNQVFGAFCIKLLFVLLILIALFGAVYFIMKHKKQESITSDLKRIVKVLLIQASGMLIVLPGIWFVFTHFIFGNQIYWRYFFNNTCFPLLLTNIIVGCVVFVAFKMFAESMLKRKCLIYSVISVMTGCGVIYFCNLLR